MYSSNQKLSNIKNKVGSRNCFTDGIKQAKAEVQQPEYCGYSYNQPQSQDFIDIFCKSDVKYQPANTTYNIFPKPIIGSATSTRHSDASNQNSSLFGDWHLDQKEPEWPQDRIWDTQHLDLSDDEIRISENTTYEGDEHVQLFQYQ